MIFGHINQDRELVAPVRVLDANDHVRRYEAVLDTGFDGALSLPLYLIQELGLPPTEPIEMVLATGRLVQVNAYAGTVLWRGERRQVRILESEGAPLIGTELLWGSLLTAEMTDNGAVTIGPLPAGVTG